MKKLTLVFALIIAGIQSQAAVDIWVSPKGNDLNEGTEESPFASLHQALRKARELRRTNDPAVEGGITIYLAGGIYQLEESVRLRPEDSGTPESPTLIKGTGNDRPVLSGGVNVTGWKKSSVTERFPKAAQGKLWEAPIPKVGGLPMRFRQLWVDDVKAVRASNLNDGELDRILSVDKKDQSFYIPNPDYDFAEIGQLEFVIHQWWAIANLRVKSLQKEGNKTLIKFHQPESRVEFEHPWPAPFIDEKKDQNGNSAFYLVNAPELLNAPGEWYLDLEKGKVYYWPRSGEDLAKADVVAPYLETIVDISGSLDLPVSNVLFEGIDFAHTTWMRPSEAGHVPLQAGFYLLDAYKLKVPGTPDKAALENQAWLGRQPGGVELSGAHHIRFEKCSFRHMAATGLDLVSGTHHNQIVGNLFEDIGGTGVQVGFFGDETFEAHLPYNPTDEREVSNNELIANNLITNVTNEDWGCVGIGAGFVHDVVISHNEVSYLNYSGISVGWGWTKTVTCMKNNQVLANEIHHFAKQMYDVGGVYTLSAQPKSLVEGNSIHHLEKAPYAHIPEHYQYIYYDEGSSFIKSKDNWTEADKFFSNSPGPGNEWINNGPAVDEKIKNQAGLEPAYQYLKDWLKK
ncbi:MAG: right-handed parallel beta-helix repeat-containing protein [Marinoscillum sp.]